MFDSIVWGPSRDCHLPTSFYHRCLVGFYPRLFSATLSLHLPTRSEVMLVNHSATGKVYALKMLRKEHVVKRNQVEHTRTERSVLGYVRHPFVVGLRAAWSNGSSCSGGGWACRAALCAPHGAPSGAARAARRARHGGAVDRSRGARCGWRADGGSRRVRAPQSCAGTAPPR